MLTIPKCPNCANDMAAMTFPWDGKGEIQVSHWTCPKCGWVQTPQGTTVHWDLNAGASPTSGEIHVKTSETKVCPTCGSRMVERRRPWLLLTFPAQEEFYWWCGCGHEELGRRRTLLGTGEDEDSAARAQWERLNANTEVSHA